MYLITILFCSFEQRSTRHMRSHLSQLPAVAAHSPSSCDTQKTNTFLLRRFPPP